VPHWLEVARANREHIVGIKIRVGESTTGDLGTDPLEVALDVADQLELPLMAHVGAPPPSLGAILEMLRPGDVLTHCFRPFPNAPILAGDRVRPEVLAARERGVVFDVGHGAGSFSFDTTRRMLEQGFLPDVISSDVHAMNTDGPAFDNLVTMSKLLSLGMPLGDVVAAATARPRQLIRRPELGTLGPGSAGDATILELAEGRFDYRDVTGAKLEGRQRLLLRGIVLHGQPWPHEDRDIAMR
ncbi:MAG: amidohydrolase/deacetylase family metallohydrolase, partial [Geminicoccales bacterium]